MNQQYDVIVIGGGTAGAIAAIQAGRAGASTLLVEKNGMLGGTMTIGGINYPAHFFAWGNQVIGGIGWELLRKTYAEAGQLGRGLIQRSSRSTMCLPCSGNTAPSYLGTNQSEPNQ